MRVLDSGRTAMFRDFSNAARCTIRIFCQAECLGVPTFLATTTPSKYSELLSLARYSSTENERGIERDGSYCIRAPLASDCVAFARWNSAPPPLHDPSNALKFARAFHSLKNRAVSKADTFSATAVATNLIDARPVLPAQPFYRLFERSRRPQRVSPPFLSLVIASRGIQT